MDDAAICRQIAFTHARTFALAARFLPPAKQRMAYAAYAFCRVADDAVDVPACAGRLDDATAGLARHRAGLAAMLRGSATSPIYRELAHARTTAGIPLVVLEELLAGVARDLEPVRYERWTDLARYCEGVASSVGELCVYIFGVQGGPEERTRAIRYARTLGLAMQLTNILRDVGEDARSGRCYLPAEDLAAHGLSADEVLADPAIARDERWAPFMALQIGRARSLYEAARPGIALLAPDAQRCARACASGYAAILGAIERNGYDVITRRASLTTAERAALFWRIWRSQPVVAAPQPVRAVANTQWDGRRAHA